MGCIGGSREYGKGAGLLYAPYLGVIRRVPRPDAELEPALGIDRHVDLPQAPCMIVLYYSIKYVMHMHKCFTRTLSVKSSELQGYQT